jgi:hypothetical protein
MQLSAEILLELQKAASRVAKRVRDPEIMRQACERMDRLRAAIQQKHGFLNIGVPAIRQLRDRA